MKKIVTLLFSVLLLQSVFAANGDSTVVRVWDKFHMNKYGAYDQKVTLPDASKKNQRIWLKYSLGCTSNGQCEWDYDIALFVRHNTGVKDSTLLQAPYVKVNGTAKDSVAYSTDTTWVNVFNATTKLTDSVPAATLTITLFGDAQNPLVVTDTMIGFTANYYRYSFDSLGVKTDSVWVPSNTTIYQSTTPYYNVFDVIENFELGRLISPYAKQFPKSFNYDYIYDITDYAQFLTDTTEFRIFYSGYSFGFTATWDVIYVEGTPARDVVDVVNIYNGGFQYGGNPSIETYLTEKTFTVPADAKYVKAKILITGHGGESSENCAEFCAKSYYLSVNNQQIASQMIWKDDCGNNPITAQGGTWIYNRANWCPGEKIRTFEYNLNVAPGSTNTLNMDIDPFTANGYASYKIALQLVYYKDNNYQIDPAIEEILAPTKDVWQSKTNPICNNAKVRLKNWGTTPIKDAWIVCQIGANTQTVFQWKGNLNFGEDAIVTLPDLIWPTDLSDRTFKAWIGTINGNDISTDENPTNNMVSSTFDLPITLPKKFIIETRTNAVPSQNNYTITDSKGNIKKQRSFTSASTLHRDTITLGFGCYTFKMNDDGGNGLGWWAAPGEGNGSLRMVTPAPIQVLKSFSTDFGSFTQLNFRVEHAVGLTETTINEALIQVYPSPANTSLTVEGIDFSLATLITVTGKQIQQYTPGQLDVSQIPTGIYILQLQTHDGQVYSRKVSIQH
jgi:hypothetical protein